MTALAVLGIVALLLLAPLAVAALRQRTHVTMALRNIGRRRAEAVLVIAGALLGTAIITSSFVVGDVIEASFADVARTQYGPVDITLTPKDAALDDVETAVDAAGIQGIDGLLAVTTATATLEAPQGDVAVPQVQVVELDLAAARDFGSDPEITGVADAGNLGPNQIVINERTAGDLDVVAGDELRLHAYGSAVDVTITRVVPEVGLAGYGGALVAPGTITSLAEGATASAVPPSHRLLVSLAGGVFDTRALSDTVVADLRSAVAGVPGVEVEAPKALVLDDAERQGAGLTEVFSMIGIFSVLAGILLLINLFVMLAEERKTELGMLRAVGFTRRRLTRAFAIEGAFYAIVASALGAVAGLGVGWLVAVVAGPIFGADDGSSFPLVIEPMSLAIGAGTGLVISLVTIWVTSLRIARLNIIRAIRDLPEPKITRARTRTLVLGAIGIVAGAAATYLGYTDENPIALVLGVPVMAFSAAPLLRRLIPERPARLAVAGTVLAWGLAVYPLFPDIMGGSDMLIFVVQGVVLTVGAVSLAASLDRVWSFAVEHLGRGGRGLAPRLGIAYPLARRFRTSMLLGMFSLVIFTVTILTSFSVALASNTDASVEKVAAGFDVLVDTNPSNPIDAQALETRDDVTAVAGLTRGVANFEAGHLDGTPEWAISGFDSDLMERGAPGLFRRDEAYASDDDVYRAVLSDPSLVIIPENFLVAGVDTAVLDRFEGTRRALPPNCGWKRCSSLAAPLTRRILLPVQPAIVPGPRLRLLMLSWRYLGHPSAGGAEVLTHEVLRRLVERGHEATSFSGSFAGAPEGDERDGVRLIRRGGQASVHLMAWRWLRRRLTEFDVVVDQINTIPFMTPLYVPSNRRMFLINQLAREYWWRETHGPYPPDRSGRLRPRATLPPALPAHQRHDDLELDARGSEPARHPRWPRRDPADGE